MRRARWFLCFVFAGLLLPAAVMAQSDELPGQQAPPPPSGQQGTQRGTMMRVPVMEPAPTMERTAGPMAPRPDLGKWWKDSEIASSLGLSEQQISQIEAAFFDHRMKLIDMHADVQRNEARLQPLMESDQVDEAKISVQIDQLLAARSRLEKANMMMMISMRKVLTVDQWKKLEEVREYRARAFMRAPQPGGPEGNYWDRPAPAPGGTIRKRPGPPPPPEGEN